MVLIKLTAGKAGLPCQSVWVSPDPCWHWAFFFFLLFCANFISVRESLGGASVYFLDGWESWTSFHFLKLTSYDPVRNVWGLSAHLSAGDLVLVQIKYCLCEAGCSSCSQWDSVSVHFFLRRSFKLLSSYRSALFCCFLRRFKPWEVYYSLPQMSIWFSADFLWFHFFQSSNPHGVHLAVRFEMFYPNCRGIVLKGLLIIPALAIGLLDHLWGW